MGKVGLVLLIIGSGIILSVFIFIKVSADSVSISASVTGICGNGVVDAGEQCDGSNLNSQTCVTRGFTGGALSCTASCTFDTSSCTSSSGGGTSQEIIVGPGGGGGGYSAHPVKIPEKAIKLCDFNGDKKCNIVDLSIMLFYFNKPVPNGSRYDLNGDGKINLVDVSILFYYWV